jgi:hypothetical protein
MKKAILSLSILLLSFPLLGGPASFTGKATNPKDKKHLYSEVHSVEYKGELVQKVLTKYKDPSGKVVAELLSTFKENHRLPDTIFTDKRNGYKEETKLDGNKYIITTTAANSRSKVRKLSVEDNLVCGQGYHNYIIKNINAFKLNETRTIKFVLPSMRDYFSFDLTYLGPLSKEKPDEVSFRLDITNFILKMFADKIQVTYSKKEKTLIRYQGLTNLKNAEGDQYDALINYSYPVK